MLSACDCTVDIGLHVSNAQICPVSIDCPLARDLLSRCRCDDQGKAAFPHCNPPTTDAPQDTSCGCKHRYTAGITILVLFEHSCFGLLMWCLSYTSIQHYMLQWIPSDIPHDLAGGLCANSRCMHLHTSVHQIQQCPTSGSTALIECEVMGWCRGCS